MNIGIASPIEVASLAEHLHGLTDAETKLGTGGTAVNILIDGFIRAGHRVTVFSLDPRVERELILRGPNLTIVFGNLRPGARFKTFDFCRKEWVQVRDLIGRHGKDLDIINAHWSYEFAIGAILSGKPHVITFRDHSQSILLLSRHPYRLTRLLMDLWVRRRGRHFTFNSDRLKELIGVPGPAIPNPVRSSEITSSRRFPGSAKTRRICFIANGWDRRKNPEAALEAFALLRKELPDTELHLFGECYEEGTDRWREQQRRGLNDGVRYRGKIAHVELMKELNGFDILLHTAREESFGNILTEAMSKGIPVVGGREAGSVPWVLDGGRAGALVDVENPADVCRALKRILIDASYYEELSRNGIDNINRRFRQSAVCDSYLRQFAAVIESGS